MFCYQVAGQSTMTSETLGNTVPCKAITGKRIKLILPAGPTTLCWTAVNTRISSMNLEVNDLHCEAHSFDSVLPNSRVTVEKM